MNTFVFTHECFADGQVLPGISLTKLSDHVVELLVCDHIYSL